MSIFFWRKNTKVYLNPLALLLFGRERQKGKPLTKREVEEVRDNAKFVMMTSRQAKLFRSAMSAQAPMPEINPDRIWEEWQILRTQYELSE